jgi:RNA polymerase sigma factor (sigma-70 family)
MRTERAGVLFQRACRLAEAGRAARLADAELLGRFVARRDQAAFADLVRRHGAMVLGVCRRVLGNADDAEDAFQAAFLVLAQRAAALRRRQSVGAWLHGVAFRVAHKARVRAARRRRCEGRVPERPPADPLAEISLREAHAILDEELLRLPDRYRAPLLLCCLEGLARDEAAARLGLSVTTLKSRLEEGRQRLRRQLARRGLSLPAVLPPALLAVSSVSAAVSPRLFAAACRTGSGISAPAPSALARAVLPQLAGARLKLGTLLAAAATLALGLGLGPLQTSGGGSAGRQGPPRQAAAQAPAGREAPEKVDALGDPLPPGALMRLGTLRHHLGGHTQLLPEGRTILTVRGDRLCWLDADSGTIKRAWPLPPGHACLGLSADGKRAVLREKETAYLWDIAEGVRLRVLAQLPEKGARESPPRRANPASAFFAPDGRSIAGIGYLPHAYQVFLWDAADGKLLWTAEVQCYDAFRAFKFGQQSPCGSPYLNFLPDGRGLVLLDDSNHLFQVRDRDTGQPRKLQGAVNPSADYHWTLTPDGKWLVAVSPKGGLRAWDVKAGRRDQAGLPRVWREPFAWQEAAHRIVFAADGKTVLLAGTDGKLRVRDWPSGKLRHEINLGGRPVWELLPTRDGRTAYVQLDCEGLLRRFDLDTGKETTPARVGHRGIVSQLHLAPDGKVVSASYDGEVHVWDLARGRAAHAFRPKSGCVFSSVSGDSTLVAAVDWEHTEVAIHERDTGRLLRTLPVGKPLRYLAFAPGGRLLLTGEEIPARVFRVWDADTGREVGRLKGELFAQPAFSPDGRLLAAVSNEGVRVFDFPRGQKAVVLPQRARSGLAFAPDGRTLACGDTNGIALWEVKARRQRGWIALGGDCRALRFSPEGRRLAWAEEDRVVLWDLERERPLHTFRGHEGNVTDLRFTPDGRALISASVDSTLLVWDLAALRKLRTGSAPFRPGGFAPKPADERTPPEMK